MVKFPLISVMTPVPFPCMTLAPIIGIPLSSSTVPLIALFSLLLCSVSCFTNTMVLLVNE